MWTQPLLYDPPEDASEYSVLVQRDLQKDRIRKSEEAVEDDLQRRIGEIEV